MTRHALLFVTALVTLGCGQPADAGTHPLNRRDLAVKRRVERRFGLRFEADSRPGFLILSRASTGFRRRLVQRLTLFHRTVYPRYFPKRQIAPLTVVVFSTPQVYWRKTRMKGTYGHYEPWRHAFFTYRDSGLGTFLHEVVHHYIHQNFGDHTPEWFNEGVASFFEMLGLNRQGYILGYTNWRLPALKRAIRQRRYTPMAAFLRQTDVPGGHGLSQARHLMVYLHHKGVLARFVRSFQQVRQQRTTAPRLIARLTGLSLTQIDREFKRLALSWHKYQKI